MSWGPKAWSASNAKTRMTPEKFWAKVDKTGEHWLWQGRTRGGYGVIDYSPYRNVKAHRVAFWLTNGHWPTPCGLHSCDTPLCCRPDHLFEGTQRENIKDRDAKGRTARGMRMGSAKLTDQDVKNVRDLYEAGIPQTRIAEQFGVSSSHISRVVRGVFWTHL